MQVTAFVMEIHPSAMLCFGAICILHTRSISMCHDADKYKEEREREKYGWIMYIEQIPINSVDSLSASLRSFWFFLSLSLFL